MFYYNDNWIAFLTETIIRKVVDLAKMRCPACSDKINSPLLHLHEQLSLLEKTRTYFEEIRGNILPTINELYGQFKHKLPHSNDSAQDEVCYIENGRQFLLTITADALYYGRYLNEMNDSYINEAFRIEKRKPTQKRAVGTKAKRRTKNTLEELLDAAMVDQNHSV